MMGMDYGMMSGVNGGTMMLFGWLLYILVAVLLVLGIIALIKYIQK